MTARLLAVEVDTAAVRAAVFDDHGRQRAAGEQPIAPEDGRAAYRMDAVWHAVGLAIRACLAGDPALGPQVAGLGFAAMPGLVLECDGAPPLEGPADMLGALDRRAAPEAAAITATGDGWLDRHGGALPPGNSLARLLWLKRNAPDAWARLRTARDLCDELARRATGIEAHSVAALATQWPWEPATGWNQGLLDGLGLAGLPALGALDGGKVRAGSAHGKLDPGLAALLGLPPGIPVAAGLPADHAGMLGTIGRGVAGRIDGTATLVAGERTTLLALSRAPRPAPGLEGPFHGALFPGLDLHAAVQPWSGGALDALLARHPGWSGGHAGAAAEVLALLGREGPAFAARCHVVPDFLGGRSPQNDPALPALATGIGDGQGPRAFLEAYYAIARGLALQLRQIVAHCTDHGFALSRLCLGGPQARNPLLVRLYRDALGGGLVVSDNEAPVLLGAAMAASAAAGINPTLAIAVDRMAPPQARLEPDPFWRRAHDAAYAIYLRLFAARNAMAVDGAALAGLAR